MVKNDSNNLFFTGGTGFFGRALLKYWGNYGCDFSKITILSRYPEEFINSNADLINRVNCVVDFVKGDVLTIGETCLDDEYHLVLHAATDSTLGPLLTRYDHFNQIVNGTENVLNFASKHGCKKFLLTSSGAVYGQMPADEISFSECYQGTLSADDVNSAYGIGKRTAEHMSFLYGEKHGFDVVVARCFAFIGEDLPLDKHFAIGNFLKDVLSNRELVINGNGTPVRSYMMQDDLASWLNTMLIDKEFKGIFNVGSDESYSLSEIAEIVKNAANHDKTVCIKSAPQADKIKNIYVPNINKAKRYGLKINYNLEMGIRETLIRLVG